MNHRQVQVGSIVVLEAKTEKAAAVLREYGDRWLVREVDRSVLARNLGYLICPATYIGTDHLDSAYDTVHSIHQRGGYSRWIARSNDHYDFVSLETG